MKSFTDLKTIDEIMYIVDGIKGINGTVKGKGGLGYKPYKMTGGMGKANPLFNPNKKIDKDNLPTNYGDNIYSNEDGEYTDKGDIDFYKKIQDLSDNIDKYIDDENDKEKEKYINKYIDTIITEYNDINQLNTKYIKDNLKLKDDNDKNKDYNEKINKNNENNEKIKDFNDERIIFLEYFLRQIIDVSDNNSKIKDMIRKKNVKDINELVEKYDTNEILEYISKKEENKPQNNLIEKIENNIDNDIKYMPKNIQDSPHFEKGNILEGVVENYDKILKSNDGDNSKAYNTKDIDAYDPKIETFLNDIWDEHKEEKFFKKYTDKESFIDNILSFVPVDLVKHGQSKYGTIWEIKAEQNPLDTNEGVQPIAYSKFIGYEPTKTTGYKPVVLNPFGYSILAKELANGEIRIDNISMIFDNMMVKKEINMLIPKDNGYRYMVYYMNKTKDGKLTPGIYNPLVDSETTLKEKNDSLDEILFDLKNENISTKNLKKARKQLLDKIDKTTDITNKEIYKILIDDIDEYNNDKNKFVLDTNLNVKKNDSGYATRYREIPVSSITPENSRHIDEITNTKKIDNVIKKTVKESKEDYNTEEYVKKKKEKQIETTKKRLATMAKNKSTKNK